MATQTIPSSIRNTLFPVGPLSRAFINTAAQPTAQVPLRPAETVVTETAVTESPEVSAARGRYNAALTAALMNPNMPVPAEFSTGSPATDAEVLRRARGMQMAEAGRAAVQARQMLQQAAIQPNRVETAPDGTRIAYRDGMPVGVSVSTGLVPQGVTGQAGMPVALTQAEAEANRQRIQQIAGQSRIAELMNRAGAVEVARQQLAPSNYVTMPVVTEEGGRPTITTTPVAQPVPLPTGAQIPRDATGRVDTAAVARMQGREPALTPLEQRLAEIEAAPTEEAAAAAAQQASQLEGARRLAESLSDQITKGEIEEIVERREGPETVRRKANRDELKQLAQRYREALQRIAAISETLGEANL